MKTLFIIQALAVGLVIGDDCHFSYTRCRCTMADGSINNDITGKTALRMSITGFNGVYPTIKDKNGTEWIADYLINGNDFLLNNCDVSKECTKEGATGADAECNKKIF
ncbi:hypothetical protein LZ32DRAFT_610172 [Colletotrichum eremochloae]|nr:hypothetical protein LZ32DRAFT_610172 [Colletotrichum eremochloae]